MANQKVYLVAQLEEDCYPGMLEGGGDDWNWTEIPIAVYSSLQKAAEPFKLEEYEIEDFPDDHNSKRWSRLIEEFEDKHGVINNKYKLIYELDFT